MNRRKFLAAAAIAAVTGKAVAKDAVTTNSNSLSMSLASVMRPSHQWHFIAAERRLVVHTTLPPNHKLITDGDAFAVVGPSLIGGERTCTWGNFTSRDAAIDAAWDSHNRTLEYNRRQESYKNAALWREVVL